VGVAAAEATSGNPVDSSVSAPQLLKSHNRKNLGRHSKFTDTPSTSQALVGNDNDSHKKHD
jgi:hypothetical protein